jgi:hypothetical protein
MLGPLPDLNYLHCLNYLSIIHNCCCPSCPCPCPWRCRPALRWSCLAPLGARVLAHLHNLYLACSNCTTGMQMKTAKATPPGLVSDASLLPYYNLPILPMYSDTEKIHYYCTLHYIWVGWLRYSTICNSSAEAWDWSRRTFVSVQPRKLAQNST